MAQCEGEGVVVISDVSGKKFNKLVFVRRTNERRNGNILWECKCDCGNVTLVKKWDVTSGNTKSCGCLKMDVVKKMNQQNTSHGMSGTKIYKIWESMKRRCDSNKTERYSNYGGRGITYCDKWDKFEGFHEWSKKSGYKEGLSIDRIDVNGNYEPSNCRWVTLEKQSFNKTNSRKVAYKNKELTIAELAKETGKSYHLLYQRIVKLGWNVNESIN